MLFDESIVRKMLCAVASIISRKINVGSENVSWYYNTIDLVNLQYKFLDYMRLK